jgi:large subunit ribosomal protein L31
MKKDIHPKYENITVTCSCGNVFKTRSTICRDLLTDVCANCHPFYTGKQKTAGSDSRVNDFGKRYGNRPMGGKKAAPAA